MPDTDAIARTIMAEKHWEATGSRAVSTNWMPPPDYQFERGGDELLAIPPDNYIRVLAGIDVPARGMISCPLPDHDDHTPSFHPYEEKGWYCFGCNRGGSIYDFAAYLWGIGDRGESFKELRESLLRALGR